MNPVQLRRVAEMRAAGANGQARKDREAANVSLLELAAALEVRPMTLSHWETGKASPRPERALRWADYLDELRKVAA